MNKDMQSMISSYIDNDLNKEDKVLFENYMNENIDFEKEVNSIKNIINQLNNRPNLSPSENFINNLQVKISELSKDNSLEDHFNIDNQKSSYWFNTNFKTTLGFSFIIVFISMFFINRALMPEVANSNMVSNSNLEDNNTLLSDSDSLKTNNEDYPILQVGGSSDNK